MGAGKKEKGRANEEDGGKKGKGKAREEDGGKKGKRDNKEKGKKDNKDKGKMPETSQVLTVWERGESSRPVRNWVDEGVFLSDVRVQGDLMVCWAIAIAATVEAYVNISLVEEKRIKASAQELIDHCQFDDEKEKNEPLKRVSKVWDKIKTSGLAMEQDYKYVGERNKKLLPEAADLAKKGKEIIKIISYEVQNKRNEMEKIMLTQGNQVRKVTDQNIVKLLDHNPVAAVLEAHRSFRKWLGGGIYRGPLPTEIGTRVVLHCIVIVGYGSVTVDGTEVKYFLIRNSHGPRWGNNGVGMVARERPDQPSLFVSYSCPLPRPVPAPRHLPVSYQYDFPDPDDENEVGDPAAP